MKLLVEYTAVLHFLHGLDKHSFCGASCNSCHVCMSRPQFTQQLNHSFITHSLIDDSDDQILATAITTAVQHSYYSYLLLRLHIQACIEKIFVKFLHLLPEQ